MAELVPDKKKAGRPQSISADEIADALIKSHGLISVAARYIKKVKTEETGKPFTITRKAIEKRIKKNPRLMEVMKQCDEEALDFAENKLMENINKNDTTSLIFYLKCKGKHRGYVEKQSLEIAGTDGGAVKIDNQIKPDFTKLSDEELRSYVEICEKLSGVDGRPES